MKKLKRYAAILGVVLLLAVFGLPMIFAFGDGEHAQAWFRGSLALVFILPVLLYAFLLMYQHFRKKEPRAGETGMIENIIFDAGNVLVDYDWKSYLESFGFSREKYEAIADATFRSRVWAERDRGLYDEEEYVRQCVALAPAYEEDIRRVMAHSEKTIHRLPYALTWVKYLKSRGYRLYILSNYGRYMLDKTRPMMDFLEYIDGSVFSCEIQELKPERAIYEKFLDMYGLDPAKSVFLDDRAENCDGARAAGILAIQFRDFRQAAAELEKLGVR